MVTLTISEDTPTDQRVEYCNHLQRTHIEQMWTLDLANSHQPSRLSPMEMFTELVLLLPETLLTLDTNRPPTMPMSTTQ